MSTEVKVPELTQDELVAKLMATLKAKQAEVAAADKPQYVTGGQFRYSEQQSQVIDLLTIRNVPELTKIAAFLKSKAYFHTDGALVTGDKTSFTWLGFTLDEWNKDLATRAAVLQIVERKKELAALETRVNAIISPEMRMKMELAALSATLLD